MTREAVARGQEMELAIINDTTSLWMLLISNTVFIRSMTAALNWLLLKCSYNKFINMLGKDRLVYQLDAWFS